VQLLSDPLKNQSNIAICISLRHALNRHRIDNDHCDGERLGFFDTLSPRMETLNAMSHPGIESFSAFHTPGSSSDPLSHAAYPASERVSTPLQRVEPPTNLNESIPNSQDTHISSSSKASAVSQLASDSSSLSNASFDTSSTSPISLKAPLVQNSSYLPTPLQIARPTTPEVRNALRDGSSEVVSSDSTSPMSMDSQQLKQGSKRTASGAVKGPAVGSGSLSEHPGQSSHLEGAGRARSSSRAAEVGQIS